MSDDAAVMVEPTACAIHAVMANVPPAAVVAVLGAGTLGLGVIAATRRLAAPTDVHRRREALPAALARDRPRGGSRRRARRAFARPCAVLTGSLRPPDHSSRAAPMWCSTASDRTPRSRDALVDGPAQGHGRARRDAGIGESRPDPALASGDEARGRVRLWHRDDWPSGVASPHVRPRVRSRVGRARTPRVGHLPPVRAIATRSNTPRLRRTARRREDRLRHAQRTREEPLMPRPGFVLDVDRSTPPLLFHHGEGLRLHKLPSGVAGDLPARAARRTRRRRWFDPRCAAEPPRRRAAPRARSGRA